MNERSTHSSTPIDAEYEPADEQTQLEDKREKPAKHRGPGWLSLFLVALIALGSLGLAAWSSGLLDDTPLPRLQAAPEASDTSLTDLRAQQDATEERLADLSAQVESLIGRVDSEIARVESDISAVAETVPAERPSEPTDIPDSAEARLSGLEDQVASLTEDETDRIDPARIDAIERALEEAQAEDDGPTNAQLVSLRTELQSLKGDLETLQGTQKDVRQQIETIRSETAELGKESAKVVSASLALAAIESTAARGEPFEAEYQKLRNARPNDGDVNALASLSQIGIPPLGKLKQDFRELRKDALARDTEESSGLGWMNTVFGDTVSVRRTDRDGETAERLADAEAALARDDLGVAIDAVEALPETTKPVFQTWLADARRRARLEHSLEDLRLKLIAAGQ
ncbi:COG4223 family protein [Henriciella aquimarina]|uniref:COG4223 family protein n=1 Tax=Henriciella aquimarina TaxID=545261 RepID=UPI0009FDE01C|nr:hypothetical protein [Henriciella aquimarina]